MWAHVKWVVPLIGPNSSAYFEAELNMAHYLRRQYSLGPGTPVTGLQKMQLYPKSDALSQSSSVRI